ncbi:MAG: HAD-IA family hydrolase [Legionellales bacterium]|jgi:phosphoglycolate phosphatase|nr:HAD-IA family hydrolase [Legionellales bacterium]
MNNYQVAIFDFDGTLCDSDNAIITDIRTTFDHFKKAPPSDTQLKTVMENGLGMYDTLKLLNPELMTISNNKIEEWIAVYRDYSKKTPRPMYENAASAIESLAAENIKIIIASNNTEKNIQKTLKKNKIDSHIELILGISDQYPLKPHPDIFNHHILPKYGTFPTDSFLMIGDTATDLQFAQNIGIDSCWAKYGIGNSDDCDALIPNYTIANITDVLPIVLGTKSHIKR